MIEMGQPVVNCDESSHEQTNAERGEHGLPNSRITTFCCEASWETLVFVNWLRRSRTTQIDMLFNKIYNKTKPYNPFSAKSKQMIQDVGNVELFELFETDPKTQCKECLSYWSEGIVYSTCGHLLKEIAANRGFIEYTLDLLCSRVRNQEGKTSWPQIWETSGKQKNIIRPIILKKRCVERQFKGIHDRFLRDHVFHERMIQNNRDEGVCRAWERSCRTKSHPSNVRIRILSLQAKLVDHSQ